MRLEHGNGPGINLIEKRLPVPVKITVKALLLYILLLNYGLINPFSYDLPFLPFLSVLDAVPSLIYRLLSVILGFSVILPFFAEKYLRISSLISGLIILFFILSSKLLFSNSLTFAAGLLLLAGLFYGKTYIFRIQISLLYLGATINKFFSEDWWNGVFMDHLLRDVFQISLYHHLIPAGEMDAAVVLGILVIAIEFALSIFVLVPKYTRPIIFAGLLFHGAMLVITLGALSVLFMYIMSAAYMAISGIRLHQITLYGGSRFVKQLFYHLDLSGTIFISEEEASNPFKIEKDGNQHEGWSAFFELIKTKQFAIWLYFTFLLGILLVPRVIAKVYPIVF